MPGISPVSPSRDSKCILAHNFNVTPGDLEIELVFMLAREALYWQILPIPPHISLLVFYACSKFLTRQGSGYCPWISIQPHIWYSLQSTSLGLLPETWLAGKTLCYCPSAISQCCAASAVHAAHTLGRSAVSHAQVFLCQLEELPGLS